MRVLIAEDESLIRMDLREMLEDEGHVVIGEASSGVEAVDLARELRPDVVFMDVKMPGMDGLEAAALIGEESIAPVVMVTAFSQSSYVTRASDAGAMAYLVKPFSQADVVPAMQVAVARFAEARALEEEVSDLEERLETRKAVERAKGVLMQQGMSEADAFERLRGLAMDRRMSLGQVAQAILLASDAGVDGAGE